MGRLEDESSHPLDTIDEVTRTTQIASESLGMAVGEESGLLTGIQLGRYQLGERIGAGGMSVVYAAYDPELQRNVAVKRLRQRLGKGKERDKVGAISTERRARLYREALAIAQLNHPNVITVFDIGVVEGALFIAMELVDGFTLKQWIREQRRGWQEVLDVFVQAGRGLAAAHRADIIHRDFKPSNVLMGRDGRIRVADFGLATSLHESAIVGSTDRGTGRSAEVESGSTTDVRRIFEVGAGEGSTGDDSDVSSVRSSLDSQPSRLDQRITVDGTLLGTPAYMAPEQLLGRRPTAQSDQYSFCVALYEALYGALPFKAKNWSALAECKLRLQLVKQRRKRRVPHWVHRAVIRGLAAQPDKRWPSMGEPLAALDVKRVSQSRRRITWALIVAMALAMALMPRRLGLYDDGLTADAMCQRGRDKMDAVWRPEVKKSLREAFLASNIGYAATSWQRVDSSLTAYARGWVAAYRDACEATWVDRAQSGQLLDRRMNCLTRRLSRFGALVDTLGAPAGQEAIPDAVRAVYALPPVSDCSRAEVLSSRIERPDSALVRTRIETLRNQIAKIQAVSDLGLYRDALADAEVILSEARGLDYLPLLAEAQFLTGMLYSRNGWNERAAEMLDSAIFTAEASAHDQIASQALSFRVYWVADSAKRADLMLRAEAAIRRSGRDQDRATLANAQGRAAYDAERFAEAQVHFERALSIAERNHGAIDPNTLSSVNNLGSALQKQGQYRRALEYYQRAMELANQIYGSEHPRVGVLLSDVASLRFDLGDYRRAELHVEESIAILSRGYGKDSRFLGASMGNRGQLLVQRGQYAEALAVHRDALQIFAALPDMITKHAGALTDVGISLARLGRDEEARWYFQKALTRYRAADNPNVASLARTLNASGELLTDRGRADRAQPHHEQALTMARATYGADHPIVAAALFHLGRSLCAQRQYRSGLEYLGEALHAYETQIGDRHPYVGRTHAALGDCYAGRSELARAGGQLERAVAILANHGGNPHRLAIARFALARVIVSVDRARAMKLAELAYRALSDQDAFEPTVRTIERWLAVRSGTAQSPR